MTPQSVLAQPLTLACGVVLKNRLVKSAMSEALALKAGRASPELARLYEVWAQGGIGLCITGNVMIDHRALGEPGNVVIEDESGLPQLQQWAKAAAEYEKIVERRPDDVWESWYPYAVLCLRAGQVDAYRKICVRLLDRFETTNNAALAVPVGAICKLAPQALPNTARLVDFLRPREKGIGGLYGHCLYRNGEHDAAVAVLLKSIPNIQDISHIWDKYFLAMAYMRLGKQLEAERWLLEANQTVNDDKTFTTRVTRWDMRIDLEMLRDEAETLIHGAARRR